MTSAGFVVLPRSVLASDWWRGATPLSRNLWLVLYASANWAPAPTRQGEDLQAGQLVTSWKAIGEHLSWYDERKKRRETPPLTNIRRAADYLRKAGEAAWEAAGYPARTGLVVTLLNWASYASGQGTTADPAAVGATEGLPEQRHPLTRDLLVGEQRQTPSPLMRERQEWLKAEREGWEATG